MGKDDQLAYAYSILDRAVSLHKPKHAVADNYDDLAMEYGFPGPAMHGVMYIKVKGYPIVQMIRGQKKKKFDCLAQKAGRGCQGPAAHRDGGRALSHVNTERKKEEARGRNPRGDSMTTIEREILSAPAQIAIPRQFASRDGTRTPLIAPGKESNR